MVGVLLFVLYLYNATRFDVEKIIYYNPPLTTQFFDRNHKLVANVFAQENRLYVKFNDIPGRVIETLIATEDTGFFEHYGFNVEAIMRALAKDIKAGKKVEGASTITQQLVKMLYLSREKTLQRKIKELFIALKVEQLLTKEQILERYLNQVYLGHGYYGIKTAAQGYFHKPLNKLTLKEIAMIIALPKAPSFYDPTKRYNQNVARANLILKRMYTLGWISRTEYQNAVFQKPTVYNSTLTRNKAPYVVDMALKELKATYPDIKTAGYEVVLSIDLPTQQIARKSLRWGYDRLRQKYDINNTSLNGAMITIDSASGDILSAVGGVDYKQSSFNRVIQSQRSIGSAVKPFVYQIALDLGYNPATKIPDISRTYKIKGDTPTEDKFWKPKNYEKDTLGFITLREALVHSRNLATINLTAAIGLDTVINGLYHFGFDNIPQNMSIVLGSFGITPLKIAQEYTLFSNYGTIVKHRLILSVKNDKKGLQVSYPIKSYDILPDYQAYLMIDILKDVVRKGTGRKARVPNIEVAGKTGTTNNFRDGWWCGFTPDTTTIVWFGNDDNTPLGKNMTGGRVSAPVFSYFYQHYLTIHPERKRTFDIPSRVRVFNVDGHRELFTNISPPPNKSTYVPIY